MLHEVVHGDFLDSRAPEGYRRFNDVALSGNGEPTTSPRIGDVVELIGQKLSLVGHAGTVKIVLITNGSMMNRAYVKDALRALAELNGEVWFKLDAGDAEGMSRINGATATMEQHLERLASAARICPTWIQTCVFGSAGQVPSESDLDAYLSSLREVHRLGVRPRGVLLYTLARPSLQPEGELLEALPRSWLEDLARRIEATGHVVEVSA
jgi:wyosine [tRNA(Phe)-imidazoG37] synthetase (radical SAM superfamily)